MLTPEHAKRIDQLAAACKAIYREVQKTQGELKTAGIVFPDSLPILLDQLNNTVDSLFVILNTPHVKRDENPA